MKYRKIYSNSIKVCKEEVSLLLFANMSGKDKFKLHLNPCIYLPVYYRYN